MGYTTTPHVYVELSSSTYSPADSTDYYLGAPVTAPSTVGAQRKVWPGINGVITMVTINVYSDNVPTGENMVFAIRKNDTTNYAVLTIASAAMIAQQLTG